MTPKSTLAATLEQRISIFCDFKDHCGAKRIETRTVTLAFLRNACVDCHVTEVEARKIALSDFASSGKALLNLDSDDEHFHATRGCYTCCRGGNREESASWKAYGLFQICTEFY